MAARTGRVLTPRALNRALLARQMLLERADVGVPRALEQMAGLQAQYAPSMYVGLWSRVSGLARDDLTHALEKRTVVQGTLLRATIHLVSASDYRGYAEAIRAPRQAWWRRVGLRGRPDDEALAEAVRRLRARLAEGPVPRKELDALVGPDVGLGVGMVLDLVRVPPSGTWERRRADLFAAADDWLGDAYDAARLPDDPLAWLVTRYLRGFGPASRHAVASWAGVPVGEVDAALGRLDLRHFRDEAGGALVDVRRAPLPDPDTPAPVRFLPTWDAVLLVHARGTGVLPEPYRKEVFRTSMPQSVGTFLVDGAVAGTWRYRQGRVAYEPFAPLTAADRRDVEDEAERLTVFHA